MHFYPFTGQATPVPVNILVALGVPALTVAALIHISVLRSQDTAPGKDRRHA